MIFEEKNPKRLRSRIYLLFYNNVISIYDLRNHLSKAFQIDSDDSWNFIIRTEYYVGRPSVIIVFLQLFKPKNILASKLNLKNESGIEEPTILPFSDPDFALCSILKFTGSLHEQEIIFNIDLHIIDGYLRRLLTFDAEYPEKSPVNFTEIAAIAFCRDLRKPITAEQLETIQNSILEAQQELNKDKPDDAKLNKIRSRLRYYAKEDRKIETPLNLIKLIESLSRNKE